MELMMECWNDGTGWNSGMVKSWISHSNIPISQFHSSNSPIFHYSTIPPFQCSTNPALSNRT